MNWYKDNRSKSRVSQLLDAKTLAPKEARSQSVLPHQPAMDSNEYTESGISSMSMNRTGASKNSVLMQKKSVFTIAYDDMATKEIQPVSSESN